MIDAILANMARFAAAWIVIVAYVFIIALVIICLIRASRYFISAGKEQKLIRMELGKLAEEVHLLRQELKGDKDSGSSTE